MNILNNSALETAILKTEAREFPFPLSTEIKEFIKKMYDTLDSLPGTPVGIAANQIATSVGFIPSMFLALEYFNEDGAPHYKLFLNPSIKVKGSLFKSKEGCLSIPNQEKVVRRKKIVEITYFSIDKEYEPSYKVENYYGSTNPISIIIQHEYDHLLGKLIGDA